VKLLNEYSIDFGRALVRTWSAVAFAVNGAVGVVAGRKRRPKSATNQQSHPCATIAFFFYYY